MRSFDALMAETTRAPLVARRIRFVREAPPGSTPLLRVTDPEPWVALMTEVPPEHVFEPPAAAGDDLTVLWCPSGHAEMPEGQQRAEAWMAKPLHEPEAPPTIELLLQGTRITWRPGRAVIHGAADRLDELLPALVSFAFYERALRLMEQDVRAMLAELPSDVPLTHSINRADLRRQPHVNTMTRRVTQHRLHFVCIAPAFAHPSHRLSRTARHMVLELGAQTAVHQRLGVVDDQLEVLEDVYELANDRLSEFRYFRREYVLELWIIAVLALEVILLLWELYR